jgi:hypothetical protein
MTMAASSSHPKYSIKSSPAAIRRCQGQRLLHNFLGAQAVGRCSAVQPPLHDDRRRARRCALRGLVAKNKFYPSDLTDAQWELIEPLVRTPQGGWPSGDAFAAPDPGLGP